MKPIWIVTFYSSWLGEDKVWTPPFFWHSKEEAQQGAAVLWEQTRLCAEQLERTNIRRIYKYKH